MPDEGKLGLRLRAARIAAGIPSSSALARRLGVHPNVVGAWERGIQRPGDIDLCQELADALAVPIHFLTRGRMVGMSPEVAERLVEVLIDRSTLDNPRRRRQRA